MKQSKSLLAIFALILEAAQLSEGYAFFNNGTYIKEDWAPEKSCLDVIAANDFYGDCCSFSDTNDGGCRLTVAGEQSSCGWNNKHYMDDCAKAGACLAGPYVTVFYDSPGIPTETCPPTQYQWQFDAPTVAPTAALSHLGWYDVTVTSIDPCPDGSVTALVLDYHGNPVVGVPVGFLLVGPSNYASYQSDSIETDCKGYATFNYTASDPDDAGQSLWCSIVVVNPDFGPGNQQETCVANVCADPSISSSGLLRGRN